MEDQEAVDLAADWADISQGLRKDLGHQLFSQWIRPIQVGSFCKDTGTLNLFLPTEFSANWVQDRFHDRLSLAWRANRVVYALTQASKRLSGRRARVVDVVTNERL